MLARSSSNRFGSLFERKSARKHGNGRAVPFLHGWGRSLSLESPYPSGKKRLDAEERNQGDSSFSMPVFPPALGR